MTMKFLKLLFSKTPILLLALLLQLSVLVLVLVYYSEYFIWFEGVSILLGLLLFMHMLERDIAAEFKLPWIFILMALPLLGAVLYLFLANTGIKRHQNRALEELEGVREEYLVASDEYRNALLGTLGDYSGIERHLSTSVHSHGFLNNRITYYGDGMAFFDALCIELETAQHFIFLEYFIISEGILYDRIHDILRRKVMAGVEVRVLYDDLGTLGKLPSNFHKKLCGEGINCRKFNKVYPILSGIYNYRDHRKIAVIDGHVGFTGGMNIGDEYAGLEFPFGKWKDSAVRIEGAAVGNMTHLFFQLWDAAGKREENFERYFLPIPTLDGTGGYVHVFGSGPRPFYREEVAENILLDLFGAARRRIYITTPYLIIDRALTNALRNAAARGVDVRIVTPHIPDKQVVFQLTRASYHKLLDAGVRIYEYTPGFIHSKQILVDDEIALVGTVNLDYRSLAHHFECAAILCRTPSLGEIGADFEEVFAVSEEITRDFRLSLFGRLTARLLSLFSPLF